MVVAAILFMIGTLHLTRIYNRGVDISAALTVLEVSEAEIRFGELERRLLDAHDQLGDAAFVPEQAAVDSKPDKVGQAPDSRRVRNSTGTTSSFFLHGKPLTGC